MQRLIWVRKRFWFAALMLGAILVGHWYAIAHRPLQTVQAPPAAPIGIGNQAAMPAELQSVNSEAAADARPADSTGRQP